MIEKYLSKTRINFARYEATDEYNRSRYTEFEKTGHDKWIYRWGVNGFPPSGENDNLDEQETIGLIEAVITHDYRLVEDNEISVTEQSGSGIQDLREWLTYGK